MQLNMHQAEIDQFYSEACNIVANMSQYGNAAGNIGNVVFNKARDETYANLAYTFNNRMWNPEEAKSCIQGTIFGLSAIYAQTQGINSSFLGNYASYVNQLRQVSGYVPAAQRQQQPMQQPMQQQPVQYNQNMMTGTFNQNNSNLNNTPSTVSTQNTGFGEERIMNKNAYVPPVNNADYAFSSDTSIVSRVPNNSNVDFPAPPVIKEPVAKSVDTPVVVSDVDIIDKSKDILIVTNDTLMSTLVHIKESCNTPIILRFTSAIPLPIFNVSDTLSPKLMDVFHKDVDNIDDLFNNLERLGVEHSISRLTSMVDYVISNYIEDIMIHRYQRANFSLGSYKKFSSDVRNSLKADGLLDAIDGLVVSMIQTMFSEIEVLEASISDDDTVAVSMAVEFTEPLVSIPWLTNYTRSTNELWVDGQSTDMFNAFLDKAFKRLSPDTISVLMVDGMLIRYRVYKQGNSKDSPCSYKVVRA